MRSQEGSYPLISMANLRLQATYLRYGITHVAIELGVDDKLQWTEPLDFCINVVTVDVRINLLRSLKQ